MECNTSTTIAQAKRWPRRSYNNGRKYSERTLFVLQADSISRRAQQIEHELIPLLTKWGKEGPTFEQINDLIDKFVIIGAVSASLLICADIAQRPSVRSSSTSNMPSIKVLDSACGMPIPRSIIGSRSY